MDSKKMMGVAAIVATLAIGVATVEAALASGASTSHYKGNAETYMNIGEAMGKAMVELLGKTVAK